MKYFTRRRTRNGTRPGEHGGSGEDPMNAVANLFDVGLVFIVGLIVMLFSAYRIQDLFSEESSFTIMKQAKDGQLEIIQKDGKKISAVKVSQEKSKGAGTRLGVAYQLENGSMVYVPE